jgi:phage-related protein
MAYVFIDKTVYYNNKKLINKFIDQQDETKIKFNKNPDKIGCVKIYEEISNHFEYFIENRFRKLRMIPEMHE